MQDKHWFYVSTAVIILGMFSPAFMTAWDLNVANALGQYYSGNPSYANYFHDAADAAQAQRMVDYELWLLQPLIPIGLVFLAMNILLFKIKAKFIKFSLIYATIYFILSFPAIFLIFT